MARREDERSRGRGGRPSRTLDVAVRPGRELHERAQGELDRRGAGARPGQQHARRIEGQGGPAEVGIAGAGARDHASLRAGPRAELTRSVPSTAPTVPAAPIITRASPRRSARPQPTRPASSTRKVKAAPSPAGPVRRNGTEAMLQEGEPVRRILRVPGLRGVGMYGARPALRFPPEGQRQLHVVLFDGLEPQRHGPEAHLVAEGKGGGGDARAVDVHAVLAVGVAQLERTVDRPQERMLARHAGDGQDDIVAARAADGGVARRENEGPHRVAGLALQP